MSVVRGPGRLAALRQSSPPLLGKGTEERRDMNTLGRHLPAHFPPADKHGEYAESEQQEVDAEGDAERFQAVQGSVGEPARLQDVQDQPNQENRHEGSDESANVDYPGCRADPVRGIERPGEVEADH